MLTSISFRAILLRAVALVMLLMACGPASAKLRLASPFTDNMVLQREKPAPVWGWADPGELITVEFAGQKKICTADAQGDWMVKLEPLQASSEPQKLTVTSKETIEVSNVLIGEVWLCAGQSNMGLNLTEVFNAKQEIAAADYPQFRFLRAPASSSLLPADNLTGGSWQICTPQTAANFAATAYFFGRDLHKALKIPIGIIEFDRGATGIECWVPLEAYQNAPSPALQQIGRIVSSWNPQSVIGKEVHAEAFKAIAAWLPTAKKALEEKRAVPAEPLLPAPSRVVSNPCETFNGVVHPLIPFAIRGVAWYQGESNPGEGEIYQLKMEAMISGWRRAWGQGDFPFYYVQLTNEGLPNQDPDEDATFRYVPVREAQRRVLRVENTGMVVAIDLGEDANGHPRNKQDVGGRLALWALAKDYKRKVAFSGPLYRSYRIVGDKIILFFDHVGSGLMVGDKSGLEPVVEVKGKALQYFAIAGAGRKWYWGEARIVGDTVVVRSDDVPAPVKLRYAYSMNPKGPKLYNREGLPASPFRTDDW
ncbi:MAG: sialate O-acetylesterase [Abditibacteriaceae bacterium]